MSTELTTTKYPDTITIYEDVIKRIFDLLEVAKTLKIDIREIVVPDSDYLACQEIFQQFSDYQIYLGKQEHIIGGTTMVVIGRPDDNSTSNT